MTSINAVQGLINQQLGKSTWKMCDNAVERLRCTTKDEFYTNYEVESVISPIFACKFAQKQGYEHILALANETGHTLILDTKKMEHSDTQIHYNAIFDVAWMYNQMKLVTASGDHSAKLVDVSDEGIKVVRMFTGHTRSVKTLAIKQDDSSIFATGGRDGNILLWDTRSSCCSDFISKPDKMIHYAHYLKNGGTPTKRNKNPPLSALNSVTGLVFQDENTLISCSAGDGIIKIWDLRKTYKIAKKEPFPRNTIPYFKDSRKCGFSNLMIDKTGSRLYASCLDNVIYCYNILTYNPNPIMRYTGHHMNTFYVKSCLSGDGMYLLSGSSDHNAYIWNAKFSEPIVRLKAHSAEVTCVAWGQSTDATLVTCSDDFTHKIWRVGPEVLPENWEIEGKGQAEILTPKCKKRELESKRISYARKKMKSCEYCIDIEDDRFCENCNSNEGKSSKRINLSHLWGENKRFKSEILTETNDNHNQQAKRLKLEISPVNSPTLNLPNYNIDGCAPHLHNSPQKKLDRDWLTKLRTEKHLIQEMREQSSPTSPSLHLEESPRTRSAKKQRVERMNSPRSPLLKFFRVTNTSIMKDSACVSKASLAQESRSND